MLSVVIPTLNAEKNLAALLTQLRPMSDLETIVSDGLSIDLTQELAIQYGARLALGSPSRGGQLRRGAQLACSEWLLFIHADCRLSDNWRDLVDRHIATHPEKAGFFGLKYDSQKMAARWVELMVVWRSMTTRFPRGWALPYGDQGLLISRRLYDEIGGYPDWPLFEDVKIIENIGRGRLQHLGGKLTTCHSKYEQDGFIRRGWRNFSLMRRYKKGESIDSLMNDYN